MKQDRACRKCGKYIPYRITIDGKIRNLENRKFCLECSPYRGHNTKSDDPSRPNHRGKVYGEWSEESKGKSRYNLYRRGITRKRELVKEAGGKCTVCGYNKCTDALMFHHRDPNEKSFNLTMNNLWSKSAEIIKKEAEKCVMMCFNCHIELHKKERDSDPTNYRNVLGLNNP